MVLAKVFRFWIRGGGGADWRRVEINERSGAGLNLMEELLWKFFLTWKVEARGRRLIFIRPEERNNHKTVKKLSFSLSLFLPFFLRFGFCFCFLVLFLFFVLFFLLLRLLLKGIWTDRWDRAQIVCHAILVYIKREIQLFLIVQFLIGTLQKWFILLLVMKANRTKA